MNIMKVTVNGKEIDIKKDATVADFIEERNVTGTMFVVEKNLKIVQKHDYPAEKIAEGDTIELVGFFGGG